MQKSASKLTRLYLDSSDYSLLSNADSDDDKALFEKINSLVQKGELTCPHSAIHVVEAMYKDKTYFQEAIARGKLISIWSNDTELIFPHELYKAEHKAYTEGRILTYNEIVSAEDRWFGLDPEYDASSIKRNIVGRVRSHIASSQLPRSKRRRLLSELSHNRGEIADFIYRTAGEAHSSHPAFQILDKSIYQNYFIDRATDAQFNREILKWLQNIPTFYTLLLDEELRLGELYNSLRGPGQIIAEKLRAATLKMLTSYREIKRLSVVLNKPAPQPKDIIGRDIENIVGTIFLDELEHCNHNDRLAILSECPGLKLSFDVFIKYIYRAVQSVRSFDPSQIEGAVGKSSFYSDLLHLAYAPYSSIFRCDRAVRGLIPNALEFNHILADRKKLMNLL